MLHQLSKLPSDLLHINLYITSTDLEVIFLKAVQEKFDIDSKYIRTVTNINQLTRVKNQCNIAPLQGSRWLIIFDCDSDKNPENSITQNTVRKALNRISAVGYGTTLVIYKTCKYGAFKSLCECAFNKSLGRYSANLLGNRISLKGIEAIARFYDLDVAKYESLIKTLSHKYSNCPDEICTLFTNIKAGYSVTSEQDIINLIGLGNITIADFIISVLISDPKNVKSRKRVLKTRLLYLNNLALELDYNSIQNLILDTLDGFIDIKMSIIAGDLHTTNTGFSAPESYNAKRAARFNRLLRYFNVLKYTLSLEYLLSARLLFKYNKQDAKVAVLNWILSVYQAIGLRDDDEIQRNQVLDFRKPVKDFDIANYTVYGEKLSSTAPVKKTIKTKAEGIQDNQEPDLMTLLYDMLRLDCLEQNELLSLTGVSEEG